MIDKAEKIKIIKDRLVLKQNTSLSQDVVEYLYSVFQTFILRAKAGVDAFVEAGGKLEDLGKKDEVYRYMKNTKLTDKSGRRLTMEEKFELIGYDRKPQATLDAWAEASRRVEEYVASGKKLSDLKKGDEVYDYIHELHKRHSDGRLMTMEEKFEYLGYEWSSKFAKDIKVKLIQEIEDYLAKGGSFHITRKQLPFWESLRTYQRKLSRHGQELTSEQVMKSLGYRNYSDTYFRFKELFNIVNYRDEDGYVDSYRKGGIKGYFSSAALTLELPLTIVISLLMEEKLKSCSLDAEYFGYVKEKLEEYIDTYGDLLQLKKNDKSLYEKIRRIKKYTNTGFGTTISSKDIIELFGIDVKHNFTSITTKPRNIEPIMYELEVLASKNGGKLKKKDIPDEVYRDLISASVKLGVTTKAFFKIYDIDYVDGRDMSRLKRTFVDKYPYMTEMLERKRELMRLDGRIEENGACVEEIFENALEQTQKVYKEFKGKIYNFEEDVLDNTLIEKSKNK